MLPVLVFFGTLAAAWWLLITRPQRQQQGRHQQLVERLAPGDHVMTVGGLYGRVQTIDGRTVIVELAPGVVTRVNCDGIARIVAPAETPLPDLPGDPAAPSTTDPRATNAHMEHMMTEHHQHPHSPAYQHQIAPPPAPTHTMYAPPPVPVWSQAATHAAAESARHPVQFQPSQHVPQQVQMAAAPATPVGYGVPEEGLRSTFRAGVADQHGFTPRGWSATPIMGTTPVSHPAPLQPAAPQGFRFSTGQGHGPTDSSPPAPTLAPVAAPAPAFVSQPLPRFAAFAPPAAPAAPQYHQAPVTYGTPPGPAAAPPAHGHAYAQPAYASVPAHVHPSHVEPHTQPTGPHAVLTEPGYVRKHSRAPEGMGTSVRRDDPALQQAFARAHEERAQLAEEYRRFTAPMVDTAQAAAAPADPHGPHGQVHVQPIQHHQPAGVALFANPAAPPSQSAAMFPAPARLPEAAPAGHVPRPTIQARQIDTEQGFVVPAPGHDVAPAFQRRAPYAPAGASVAAG